MLGMSHSNHKQACRLRLSSATCVIESDECLHGVAISAGNAVLLPNPGLCMPEQPTIFSALCCLAAQCSRQHPWHPPIGAQQIIMSATCKLVALGMSVPPGVDRPQFAEKALDMIFVKRLPSHKVVLANARPTPQTYTCYQFWPAEVSQPSAASAGHCHFHPPASVWAFSHYTPRS